MHLLVTRPREDAEALAVELEAAGHRVTVAPLTEIIAIPDVEIDLDGVAALAATSRNALRALADHPARAAAVHLPLYAVGRATADLARALGFQTVVTGAGRAADLVAPIRSALPAGGTLLHLAGEQVAFDLAGTLSAAGLSARRIVLYRSVSAGGLPAEAVAALAADIIDGVVLLSPNASRQYWGFVAAASLQDHAARVLHICLSHAVADALPLDGAKVAVATRPNRQEMLALVARLAAQSYRRP